MSEKKSEGKSLPTHIRVELQQQFGTDLSQIRVQESIPSDVLSKMATARAYTHGNTIFLKASMHSPEGRKLLSHELTHVMQQGPGKGIAAGSGDPGV